MATTSSGAPAADGDNIVWGTDAGDNIVWGTAANGDNIVWGTDDGDNIVWGTSGSLNTVWITLPDGTQTQLSGSQVFDKLKDKALLKLLEYTPPPIIHLPEPPPAPDPSPAQTQPPPAVDPSLVANAPSLPLFTIPQASNHGKDALPG